MRRCAITALAAFLLAAALGFPAAAARAEPPAVGGRIPAGLTLAAPLGPQDAQYLGIGSGPVFKLQDVKAPYILLEVVGVYCPQCHTQAPLFDKFFTRLKGDPGLSGKVKMLGMAAGATKEEMEYLRETGVYSYPVASDPDFAVHKALGEPKTPFTMLLDAQGKVLYAHLGIIQDMDAFHDEMTRLAR